MLILLLLQLAASRVPSPDIAKTETMEWREATRSTFEPYQLAVVSRKGATWQFTPNNRADGGIHIKMTADGTTTESDLQIDGMGEVVGVVAASRAIYIALGVASFNPLTNEIEYRILFSREGKLESDKWLYSQPLMKRSLDAAFGLMSIGLPGGDSVVFTLKNAARDRDGVTQIEAHEFVNHCPNPLAGERVIGAKHYTSSSKQVED